ncbi:MAG TPA: ABC transporter permease [Trebonia sp.]|jgi:peptide/nickel transport system permease protein
MTAFIIRRTMQMAVVLFCTSVFTFLIFQVIPNGNPALRLAGQTATPQTIAAIERQWGFNKPIYVQYVDTMQKVLTGSVISYSQQINVLDQIRRGLPATISLAGGAAVLWLLFGIALGTLSALKAGRFSDRALAVLSLVGISTPSFVLASALLYLLAYKVHVFPLSGYVPLTQSPWQWFLHLVLPWFCLSFINVGFYSRVLRSNMLDTLQEDYVRTATAKGLSRRRVIVGHVLRASLIPLISLWGLDFAGVIGGGAILVEVVFNLNGVGQYAAQSIQTLDVPPVLVIVMYGAFLVVVLSAIIDVLYVVLDPRVRLNA